MSKYQASLFTADGDGDAHAAKLVDIHQTRLEKMDAHGVEYCVLSLTAPGIQDFVDPKEAAERRHWRTTGLRRRLRRTLSASEVSFLTWGFFSDRKSGG